MVIVNNMGNITISYGDDSINNISQNKAEAPNPNAFTDIYNSLLKKNSKADQCNIDSAKIQAKLDLDINRLAKLMGIGPKTLMAVIGELKVDPNNYDFKIQTN